MNPTKNLDDAKISLSFSAWLCYTNSRKPITAKLEGGADYEYITARLVMDSKSVKRYSCHMSVVAAILGIAGVFLWFNLNSLVLSVLFVVVAVAVINIVLRSIGYIITKKLKIENWLKITGTAFQCVNTLLVSACGLFYIMQDNMMFYSVTDNESREFLKSKPRYSEVEFTADSGKTYHGVLYRETSENAPLVIYFGGNGEVSYRNLRNREEKDEWQYFEGYSYLCVDYEGYGLNDGKTSYLSMYEEAIAVFDYAAALPNVDKGNIVAMGYSIGTGSAVYLAANRPVSGLILAAPYANGFDIYNYLLPVFNSPLKLLIKQKFPSDVYAPKVTCPVLIIASKTDEIISFASSERLSKLFSTEVDFVALEASYHNEIFDAEGVFDLIKYFLAEVVTK